MKKISIVVPTYNEEDNVELLSAAIVKTMETDLPQYDYELIFIDNFSKDQTRVKLRQICSRNKRIKAIFNAKNFGWARSPYYGVRQSTGDCTVLMSADFQDPVQLIPKFVAEWENGYKIVIGTKTRGKESRLMFFIRNCYYKMMQRMSDVEQIQHFTCFGLYDKAFVEILRDLDDPMPYMRGIVAELGFERKEVSFVQPKRKAGKSKGNFFALYDMAMLGITSYTKNILRVAIFIGFIAGAISFLTAVIYLIMKLVFWNSFQMGMAPVIIGMFLIGSIQLFFIGLLGEYIMAINTRVMKRPLVIEEQRLNFDDE